MVLCPLFFRFNYNLESYIFLETIKLKTWRKVFGERFGLPQHQSTCDVRSRNETPDQTCGREAHSPLIHPCFSVFFISFHFVFQRPAVKVSLSADHEIRLETLEHQLNRLIHNTVSYMLITHLGSVVQRGDSTIQLINCYPLDK